MEQNKSGRRGFLKRSAMCAAGAMTLSRFQAIAQDDAEQDDDDRREGRKKKAYTSLFNGKDLTGWTQVGGSVWEVQDGILIGKQGPDFAPGDLFTDDEFSDFELVVTFKMEWPGNSGVWFRYQTPEKAYQADVLEYKDPVCYAGTLYCPGKMFLAMNEDPSIVKREDWNTFLIRAKGDHLVIRLNGVKTADVHDDSTATGKIGFQIHPGEEFKDMRIHVREVKIRPIEMTAE